MAGNLPETERDEHKATHLTFSSGCTEACETRDEGPNLNLGRGKQADALRAADTDLRVERLQCESTVPGELMTVSSILVISALSKAVCHAKDGGYHPRECDEALASPFGCNGSCEPSGERDESINKTTGC